MDLGSLHKEGSEAGAATLLFFCGLQDSCPFLSSKRAFRTPDEPEVRRNNGRVCMQQAFSPPQMIPMMGLAKRFEEGVHCEQEEVEVLPPN